MVTKIADSMLENPAGSTGELGIAYTTTIPLDRPAGKLMTKHTVSSSEAWTVAPGPIEGGACRVVLIGSGGSLAVPANWAFVQGSSPPSLSAGTRNLIAVFYVDNTVLWSVTPMPSVDTVVPTLVSIVVADSDATKITLTWSEPMSAAISAATAFTVSSGHPLTAHTYVDSTHSYLTTSTPFVQGETKTLTYTQPAINLMQDLAGNLLANVVSASITDNVGNPTLISATVLDSNALQINLVWSEAMNSSVSAAAAFALSGGHTITAHVYDTATTSHLTVTTAFISGETSRTLSYTQPGSNKMQDLFGNLCATFSGAAVTNSVTSPTLVSAVVANGTPGRIDLTWSEAINSTISAYTNFAVSAGHALTAHTYVDATHTYLTTSANFVASETKTLAYTASGTNDMKDTAGGNLVQNFSGATITDNVAAVGGITDNFGGTYPTRSDGGSWTTLTGTAPVNSAGKLIAGAAAGEIIADLTYQDGTYGVDVNTTVGTFTPIMRVLHDGSSTTTNYIGIAIDNTNGAFGVQVYTHNANAYSLLVNSTGPVFTSGVTGRLTVELTAGHQIDVKFNGTIIPGLGVTTVGYVAGRTFCGLMVPASGVTFDNYSAI